MPLRPTRALAAALALGLALVAPAGASHVGESLDLDQQLVAATDQLLAALAQWNAASGAAREQGSARLTQLAEQREARFVALLQQDARIAAARMLPQRLRARLPAAAAAHVERMVHVRGTALLNVSDNFAAGHSRSRLELHGDGAVYNVFLADAGGSERDLHAAAGKAAALDALAIADNLVVLDRRQLRQAAGSTATTSGGGTTVAAAGTVQGTQNTLSILLNFTDKPIACTAGDVANRLFAATGASVNNNYKESSRGLVGFTGQAIGPFTIGYASTGSCDYGAWASAADAAARAAGVDPAAYQRVNYVTPPNATCGWSGLAYMPGRQSWVQSCGATGVFSHELGHNLSLHHAATPSAEYGDASDPMGGARVVDHNAANRSMAGWMPQGSVQDVTVGGSYALATVSSNAAATAPQVLRIAKPDTGEFYYVSLRQALNLDAGLGTAYLDNLSVHRATGTLPTRTYLLGNLATGQSYSDATNGIAVTNQGVSSGVATVAVTFGGGTCTRTAPSVAIAPASQTAGPGTTLDYTVTVGNRNSSACGTGTFALAQTLPAGFAGGFGAGSLSIAPGASASTGWAVSSSAQVAAGTYTLTASATDSGNAANSTAAHASDIVFVDTTAPTLTITSPTAGATVSGRVAITATASDDRGIQAVEFYVDGALLARDTLAPWSANWNARKAARGAHTIRVRAIDTAGNAVEQSVGVTVK